MMTLYRQTPLKSTGCRDVDFSPYWGLARDRRGSLGNQRVEKRDGGYDVWIDIPGVLGKDVDVHVKSDGDLEVKARRYWGDDEESRTHEDYHRVFSLSELIDKDSVEAEVKEGVLKLGISFVEQESPRRVEVKV